METTTPTQPPSPSAATPTDHTATSPAIEVRGLVVRYGTFDAVCGIDLEIQPGELFALLGTNGAGKTTTLETLQGHRAPDVGSVRVLGLEPAQHRRELAARVGVVLQRSGAPDDLTPAELLRLWQRLQPKNDAATRRRPTDPIADVGLERRRDVRIRQLSGGELRRLDLALAISTSPELLFLDEPTTGMDPEGRERVWQLIRSLQRAGTTIVLTTHYLEEAEALADRIAIMDGGRLAAIGARSELVARESAQVRCQLPTSPVPELPPLSGDIELRRSEGRTHLHVDTTALQSDLTTLLDWARQSEVELHDLHASEASLARVFHAIANRSTPLTSEDHR